MTSGIRFRAGVALGLGTVMTLVVALLAGCGGESLPAGCEASRGNYKYCLDHGDSVLVEGVDGGTVELFRVVAVRDIVVKFPGRKVVKVAERGDRGGYVEGEWNLSFDGAAWVGDDATVRGRAKVLDNAFVYGNAEVSDTAQIYGNALVFGNARVLDSAKIYDRAEIYGDAMVFDRAESVFDPDDPARTLLTNSFFPSDQFSHITSFVKCAVAGQDCEGGPEFLQSLEERRAISSHRGLLMSTHVFGEARVYGDSRVWGGSHLTGWTRVKNAGRVSGGSTLLGGDLCGDAWVNSSNKGASTNCRR